MIIQKDSEKVNSDKTKKNNLVTGNTGKINIVVSLTCTVVLQAAFLY